MKNLMVLVFSVSLLIGVTLLVGCVRDEATTINDITPQEAFSLMQDNMNNPDFVIIDVRTREKFSTERIENATNIDFYSETLRDILNNLDKNKKYLIYCRSGARSGSTLDMMAELNFNEAYNISGGINRWKSEGFPTVK